MVYRARVRLRPLGADINTRGKGRRDVQIALVVGGNTGSREHGS